jgi:predicted Zn-dependent peptidase
MLSIWSERWTEEQVKDTIANIGGSWNGWTNKEQTGFYALVADLDVEIALDWLSQIVFHPTFPVDKVEKERHVVFQEKGGQYGWFINQLEAWGYGYDLWREVEKALFPNSTLTMTVIGEEDSLKRIDRNMLLDYYKQHYNTKNATLIVVGNVEASQLRPLVAKYFGDLRSHGEPTAIDKAVSADKGAYRVKVAGPMLNDQIRLITGTQTVGDGHSDRWSLDVLAKMMSRDLSEEIRVVLKRKGCRKISR